MNPQDFRTSADDRFKLTDEARRSLRAMSQQSDQAGWVSPLRYNLSVSHEHRFVWFRVAKVASRTIRHHFTSHGVALDVDHAMRVRYPTALFGDYFKFGFVRDPLARFVSAWQDKVVNANYYRFDEPDHARMQRVEEFALWTAEHDLAAVPGTDQHLALQSRLIDLSQVDFVGRIETFAADFAEVCERVGAPAGPAEARNQTGSAGASGPQASDELRSLVATMYRRDYQVFGY